MENSGAKKKRTNVFKNLKAEFKKIIWPERRTFVREVIAVIVVGVILGLAIGVLDLIIKFVLNLII